ncbi:MAG: choice-of-anchor P family protein [Marmoricola sp.]
MRRLVSALSATALVVTAGIAAAIAPANAATPQLWVYQGSSGGTQINALGTTISSGPTAASNLADSVVPNSHTSTVASVHVGGVLDAGAVESGQTAARWTNPGSDGNGVKITSRVRIAGLNLFSGAIKLDAVDSTSYAAADSTTTGIKLDGGTTTTFLNLSIGGNSYPASVPANTTIDLGSLAKIVINETKVIKGPKAIQTSGSALHITLLKASGPLPAGAEIWLNQTQTGVSPAGASDALPIGGFAYGTFAGVQAGNDIKVLSQPTGMVSLPSQGTNGTPYTNSTASVNVPGVAQAGVLQTLVNGKTIPGYADANTGAQVAKVNLLGGLITADAIGVTSHVQHTAAGDISEAQTNFVNLVVAGKQIPINVPKNTQIYIFGVGQVWINQQMTVPGYSAVVGVRVTLSVAKFGLPVGADIHLAVAASYISLPSS